MNSREKNDLIISWLVISVAFGFAISGLTNIAGLMFSIPIAMLAVGTGFICHELAHKYIAIKYGCQAEYRAWNTGLILALLLGIFLRMVFAAPGAVYIFGPHITRKQNGIISLSGPLTNLILGIIFLAATIVGVLFLPINSFSEIIITAFSWAAFINFFLGLFNMIPFPPLDGSKIFAWNPIVWGVVSVVLFVFVFFRDMLLRLLLGF